MIITLWSVTDPLLSVIHKADVVIACRWLAPVYHVLKLFLSDSIITSTWYKVFLNQTINCLDYRCLNNYDIYVSMHSRCDSASIVTNIFEASMINLPICRNVLRGFPNLLMYEFHCGNYWCLIINQSFRLASIPFFLFFTEKQQALSLLQLMGYLFIPVFIASGVSQF